jgi:hypothetical protein
MYIGAFHVQMYPIKGVRTQQELHPGLLGYEEWPAGNAAKKAVLAPLLQLMVSGGKTFFVSA